MRKKILLLGSGELGKEVAIALQRLGQYVIAVDNYENAPAMQVAHEFEVINMLDGEALDSIVTKHQPDFIVPEVESIRTERFYDYEKQGYSVIPSAKAANFTMNRKAIRDLAATDLGVKTARYKYAISYEEYIQDGDENYSWPTLEDDAACALCYTSGTTGIPKGVLYSHKSNVIHAQAALTAMTIKPDDTILFVVVP